MRKKLIEQLNHYEPFNEQEAADRTVILSELKENSRIFFRENRLAHMTASGWVLNSAHDRILMCFHNIYHSWSWLGGHADGREDLLAAAIAEVKEESGLTDVVPVTDDVFSLEVLTVDGHEKNGQYVPSHLHLNITYLLEADDSQALRAKTDENSAVAWFLPGEAAERSSEEWFKARIYAKLNRKLLQKGIISGL